MSAPAGLVVRDGYGASSGLKRIADAYSAGHITHGEFQRPRVIVLFTVPFEIMLAFQFHITSQFQKSFLKRS